MGRIYKSWVVFLITPAIAGLFAGCGLKGGDQALEEIVEETYQVEPAAHLSITNGDGAIRVYGADISEIHVHAVKKAYSTARLRKIDINISAQPGAVSIQTNFPPATKWGLGDRSGTVDYTLIVPQTCVISKSDLVTGEMLIEGLREGSAHAHLGTGRLFAHNCFGDIHLSVVNGGVDVYYDWWEEQRKFAIDADIVNGSVHVFIPADASFRLIAQSESGQIADDFVDKEQRHAGGMAKIDKVVGSDAQVEVRLRARSGNIKVSEVAY